MKEVDPRRPGHVVVQEQQKPAKKRRASVTSIVQQEAAGSANDEQHRANNQSICCWLQPGGYHSTDGIVALVSAINALQCLTAAHVQLPARVLLGKEKQRKRYSSLLRQQVVHELECCQAACLGQVLPGCHPVDIILTVEMQCKCQSSVQQRLV
jgi:hypothetical protein